MPTYQVSWHHRLFCHHLDRLVRGECKRLMIFTPPRHGKSELASRRMPAYYLGLNPAKEVISTSYSGGLASRMNRDVQRVIDSPRYAALFPGTRLNGSNVRAKSGGWLRNDEIFEVVGGGGSYRSAGVGGGISGMGFHLGLIDDPFKNREEADSPTIREKVWEWYTSTFWTRQAPGASIGLIQTRWHEDDLAGRLLKQMRDEPDADRWEVVNLEAVRTAHPSDPADGRATGDALWPDRYDRKFLDTAKASIGSRDFQALYQGRPTEDGGNLWKEAWFAPRWEWASLNAPDDAYRLYLADGSTVLYYTHQCPRYVVIDPAASEQETADYTAAGTFCHTPTNELLVLDMWRDRVGVDRIVPRLLELCLKWKPDWCGVEASGFQVALVKEARRTGGIPAVRQLQHKGKGKLVRATPAIIKSEAGQVLLPKDNPPWVRTLLDELTTVRLDGKDPHDDQADVLAYAVQGMPGGGGATAIECGGNTEGRSRDREGGRR